MFSELMKVILKKSLISAIGILIMDFGVGILIKANVGVDPYNVFCTGLSCKLHITEGFSVMLVNAIVLLFVLLIDKSTIGVATVLETLICQYPIDLACSLFVTPDRLWLKVALCLLSILVVAVGVCIMMINEFGLCVYDAFSCSVSGKYKLDYTKVRYSLDTAYLILGVLFGGQIGIGTILCYASFGALIPFMKKQFISLLKNNA